jgi:hypothetical protein
MRDRSLHLARSFNQSSHLHSISSLARRSFPWSSLNPEGLINAKGLSLISACRVERALPLSLNPPRQRNILLAALRHHKGILRHSYPLFGGVPIFISVAMLVRAITLAAAWFPILSYTDAALASSIADHLRKICAAPVDASPQPS